MALTTLSKHIDTVSVLYDVLLTKPIYLMRVDLFSEDVLSVSIPLEGPQRPLLGGSLLLPCYFEVCNFEHLPHDGLL